MTAWTLIQHTELTGTQASISFSSIPQTYTDLVLLISARNNSTALGDTIQPTINGSTANFSGRLLYGVGSGSGTSVSLGRYFGSSNGGTTTSNTFSSTTVYIPNYTESINKSFSVDSVIERNGSEAYQYIYSGLWSNTAAITSISISIDPFNSATGFVSGSSATLYGVLKGSSGGVTVS